MRFSSLKNKRERSKYKNMSDRDKQELELLNLQIKSILIYMVSDLFLFLFSIEAVRISCNKGEEGANPLILQQQGESLALIASIINYYINSTRYSSLINSNANEESIELEGVLTEAGVLIVIVYALSVIVSIKRYDASLIIDLFKYDKNNIYRLFWEGICFLIRFYGDYFLLSSTLKSIDLIRSKYDSSIKNIYNPDIDAVIAAEFYVLQRGVLYDINCSLLQDLINNGSDIEKKLLIPIQQVVIFTNIMAVIANTSVLSAFTQIYNKNVDEPIFGR